MLKYTHSTEESKKLNNLKRPAIIISASGMCEGGRVLHHLRRNIGDPNTTVLFVGFQAENTLGRKLLQGDKIARIYGEEHVVRARMEEIDGYSAHADEGELLEFIAAIPKKRSESLWCTASRMRQRPWPQGWAKWALRM